MLSKDIEQIKYKDSHGREVIPLWRLQDLLKEAKKEVFEDIETQLYFRDMSPINKKILYKLKKKHLVEKH